MSIQVQGIKQTLRALEDYKDTKTKQLEDTTDEATINVERMAKRDTPVDTGQLRSSIHRNINGLDGSVYTNAEYGPYIEFGTGALVDVPAGLEDYALQFKGEGKRQVNIPASPYLFPSWNAEKPKYIKRIKKILGSGRIINSRN